MAGLDIQIDSVGSTNAILTYSPIRFSAASSQGDSLTSFTGTLMGDRSIRITLDGGGIEFRGDVILKDTFPDHSYSFDRRLILATRGGSADGMTLNFTFYDPF